MSLVFINYPLETFTPTASGALATILWECCQVAEKQGREPVVLTRSSAEAMFPWKRTVPIVPPSLPTNPVLVKALRAQRRLTGWRHLRHRAYAIRVVQAIKREKLEKMPFVLINDPEMTVLLRSQFPDAFLLHWFENQHPCSEKFRQRFASAANVVCGVSDFTSRWIAEYYGAKDVKTLYNGVDATQFRPAETPTPGIPFLNFVGRTGIEKAPDLLLNAAVALSAKTKAFGLQIVGSNHWDRFEMDDYQRQLQGLVEKLETAGIEVRRPGHVGRRDLPATFHKAHIHVVPSRWDEPFGLTTVEGMASGLAIVASNTGGTPEVVGDAGLLFARDSVEELTAALESLVCDADLRQAQAQKARERALTFPWERTWGDLLRYTGIA